jgi:hypothetical protein
LYSTAELWGFRTTRSAGADSGHFSSHECVTTTVCSLTVTQYMLQRAPKISSSSAFALATSATTRRDINPTIPHPLGSALGSVYDALARASILGLGHPGPRSMTVTTRRCASQTRHSLGCTLTCRLQEHFTTTTGRISASPENW